MPEPFRALDAPMALTEVASLEDVDERHLIAYLGDLSRVLQAAAHDIRGPLHTIALQLELLRQSVEGVTDPDLRARQGRHVEGLAKETKRLQLMLDALWGDDGGGTFDLREIVEELQALLDPYCRRNRIRLGARLPQARVDVSASSRFVRHAALDLFLRALDLSPQDGEIELSVEASGRAARLSVAGSAARPERRTAKGALWGEDDRADAPDPVVARQITERYGGRVLVEVEVGGRLRLYLELPLSTSTNPGV